jgi:glycosyltransferase involved in cell wall biosynthesis
MKESRKVSVVIPVFNRSVTILRTIESVLSQTYPNVEAIVVDDGSTDSTRALVEGLSHPKIRLIAHQRNQGAAASRNTGMRAAEGEYLAFLDSDDEWLPDKLSVQIALLESLSPEWGMSCSAFYLVAAGSQHMTIGHAPADLFMHLLSTCDLGPGSTLVVKRGCIDKVGGFDEEFERLEDWDWLLRLAKYYRLAYVRRPLARIYKYGVPPADATQRSTLRFLSKHETDLRACSPFQRRRILSRHFLRLAHFYYLERKSSQGNRYLVKALLANPLQNPLRFVGAVQSLVDGWIGTRISTQAILLKRRYLRR